MGFDNYCVQRFLLVIKYTFERFSFFLHFHYTKFTEWKYQLQPTTSRHESVTQYWTYLFCALIYWFHLCSPPPIPKKKPYICIKLTCLAFDLRSSVIYLDMIYMIYMSNHNVLCCSKTKNHSWLSLLIFCHFIFCNGWLLWIL